MPLWHLIPEIFELHPNKTNMEHHETPKNISSDDVPFQRKHFSGRTPFLFGVVCVYRRAIGPRCGHMSSVQGGSPKAKTDRKALGEPYIRDASSNGSFRVGVHMCICMYKCTYIYIIIYTCIYIYVYFLFYINAHRIRLT